MEGDGDDDIEVREAFVNNEINFKGVWDVIKASYWLLINMNLSFYLEYVATTGFSDRSTMRDTSNPNIFIRNSYVLIQLGLTLGLFLGMSSLLFVKIKHIEPTTLGIIGLTAIFGYYAYLENINVWVGVGLSTLLGVLCGVNHTQGMDIF